MLAVIMDTLLVGFGRFRFVSRTKLEVCCEHLKPQLSSRVVLFGNPVCIIVLVVDNTVAASLLDCHFTQLKVPKSLSVLLDTQLSSLRKHKLTRPFLRSCFSNPPKPSPRRRASLLLAL